MTARFLLYELKKKWEEKILLLTLLLYFLPLAWTT